MFDYNKILTDFGLDSQTSEEMIKAIEMWSSIFNGRAPWVDNNEIFSLNTAKTICEKVASAVTIELKTKVSDNYLDSDYQKVIKNIRKYVEYAIGKGNMFFKPVYEEGNISVSIIQADKFIPFKFDSSGKLTGIIIIDQVIRGNDVYTRLELNELTSNKLHIKNICYKGRTDGVILGNKVSLSSVDKWKSLEDEQSIEGINKIIGGFFNMPNSNTIDNNSPLGMSIFHNAIGTLEQIDKQFSRTIWEYEGSELAIDIDESALPRDKKGNTYYPHGKKRLFRKVILNEDKDKTLNVFSPTIRDTSLFNGLNELLRQAESECQLAFGTLSKSEGIAKTATEIKTSKQDYYVLVSSIQTALQVSLEDLVYGIYVLRRLYQLPVGLNYDTFFDWDDSILVDKESVQRQSLVELNAEIIDKVQYLMETRDYSEEEAIEFIQKIDARKPKESELDKDPDEE